MVVIKNFEIPENCLFCRCYQDSRCVLLNQWNCVSGIKRLNNCPLEEHVTCKNCKNLQNDWGTLRCEYTGDLVDAEWYCKGAEAREVEDE